MKTKTAQTPTQLLRNTTQLEGLFLEQAPNGKWLIKQDPHHGLDEIEREERQYLDKTFFQDILWALSMVLSTVVRVVFLVIVKVIYYALVLIGYVFLSIGQLLTGMVPSPGRQRHYYQEPPMSSSRPANITINQIVNIKK